MIASSAVTLSSAVSLGFQRRHSRVEVTHLGDGGVPIDVGLEALRELQGIVLAAGGLRLWLLGDGVGYAAKGEDGHRDGVRDSVHLVSPILTRHS